MGQPKIIPAMVADSREAKEPPNTAFMPNSDSVLRCVGARNLCSNLNAYGSEIGETA